MQIESITIKNYKAIKEVTLRLNKNLIPIVGINEAGKSTILEAIMAFFPDNDNYKNGRHLDPTNIYSANKSALISTTIKIDNLNEIRGISRKSGHAAGKFLQTEFQKGTTTFEIQRSLPNCFFTIINPYDSSTLEQSLIDQSTFLVHVFELMPKLIYFEDFLDQMIQEIVFERIDNAPKGTTLNETSTVGQVSLIEAFKRTGIDFDDFLKRVESGRVPTIGRIATTHREDLRQVEKTINSKLADAWIQVSGLTAQSNQVYQVEIQDFYSTHREADGTVRHKHEFWLRLIDTFDINNPSAFNFDQRSKGYQWFCNFQLKLAFNSTYTGNSNQAVFLLDEPGAYLHPSAQERLLDQLIGLSKQNKIIYSTHLPQLVNPSKIRIHDCLVAYRENSEIALKKYGEFDDQQNLGALTTLHNAMKLTMPGIIFPNSTTPFVLTEGITEFYVLEMVKNLTAIFDDINISIIPGQGVTQLQTLISLCIGWSEKYVVIFDKDEEANKAIEKYEEIFGEEQKKTYWLQLENKANDNVVALERLFTETDRDKLLNLLEIRNIKRAFETLYFSDLQTKLSFWDHIDDDTKENFNLLATHITKILT